MEKRRIAGRFGKALGSYDEEGFVQHSIAHTLAQLLGRQPSGGFDRIAEVGCGTGFLTQELLARFSPSRLWANDLCAALAPRIGALPGVSFEAGDMETVSLPQRMDLIAGSSSIHWIENPSRFFARCHAALRGGGWIAFSSFGPQTFREIRALTGQGLHYLTADEYREMLEPWFELTVCRDEMICPRFPSPSEVLRHLQRTGVTAAGSYTWTRSRLAEFGREYLRNYASEQGVRLTYQPIYIIGKSKE